MVLPFHNLPKTYAELLDLSGLAVALIHPLRKLFQKFPETVRNWLCTTKIVLRL